MKNREVFKVFRQHIDPVANRLGFERLRNDSTDLPWTRKLEKRRHETFWCQMDKWQWDPWMGSKFTLRFQDSRHAGVALENGAKFATIGDLLAGKAKQEAERIQNTAISKIRVPTKAEYDEQFGCDFADDFILDEYREASKPVKFGRELKDLWLRVVDEEDVATWAAFLSSWLPDGWDRFAKLEGEEYLW